MKFTANLVLAVCAVTLFWVAGTAFAAASGDNCPTTVTFDAQGKGSSNCTGQACLYQGKAGTCALGSFAGTQFGPSGVPLWTYNGQQWVASGQYWTGTIHTCGCKVNMGTEEEPNFRVFSSACCDLATIPGLQGTPTVAIVGDCGIPGCTTGTCKPVGNQAAALADCQ